MFLFVFQFLLSQLIRGYTPHTPKLLSCWLLKQETTAKRCPTPVSFASRCCDHDLSADSKPVLQIASAGTTCVDYSQMGAPQLHQVVSEFQSSQFLAAAILV